MSTRLRQIVLLAADMEPSLSRLQELLGTTDGDVDPAMAEFGLTHEVLRVGRDTYIELCAPLAGSGETAAKRFLARGGEGGYMVVIEVPDAAVMRQRIQANGWAVPLAQEHHANELTQLHPRDFGTLLEADQVGSGHDWHYPALEGTESTDRTTGIVAADVAVADPAEQARRWATAFELTVGDDGASVVFPGGGLVRFVPSVDGRTGAVAYDIAATQAADVGTEHVVAGVTLRFVR